MLKLEGFPLLSAPHPASTLLESPFNTVCEICLLLLAETVERAGTSREDPVPGQPWATVTGDWNTGHHPLLLLSSLCTQVTVKSLYWEVEPRK